MPETTKCLSILVAVLNENFDSTVPSFYEQGPLDGNADGNPYDEGEIQALGIQQYAYLEPVTKLTTNTDPVYDEGDVRLLYVDHTVSVEFVLTPSSKLGDYIDGGVGNEKSFNERLALLERLLRQQGLGICFNKFPSPVRNLHPGNEENTNEANPSRLDFYKGGEGWLIDNHNGPKTLSVEFMQMAGSESIMVSWKFKARVAHIPLEYTGDGLFYPPKLSQELRLDIDNEGDLMILMSGTIYANSLQAIYQARDYLELEYIPSSIQDIRVEEHGTIEYERWAMINGFLKDVSFNIEKNGRSAQYRVKYTQVKSNNAMPNGIRNIKFEQSVESNFISDAFRRWTMKFKGEVTIPSRMNALYAWYVFHLLVLQQTRRTTLKIDSKQHNNESGEDVDTSLALKREESYVTCLPMRLKWYHSHFARKLKFEIDYMLLCSLEQLATATCIFDRINNDYQRKLDRDEELSDGGTNNYSPYALSVQWYNWTKTVDPQYAFDPETLQNPLAPGRPNRDTAGSEILDTGHNYDAHTDLASQKKQRTALVTTVVDPNDLDAQYRDGGYDNVDAYDNVRFSTSVAGLGDRERSRDTYDRGNDYHNGSLQDQPLKPPSINRPFKNIAPEVSWLKYEQTYEFTETNPTLPLESLSDIAIDQFDGTRSDGASGTDSTFEDQLKGGEPLDPATLAQKDGLYYHGRTSLSEPPDPEDTEKSKYTRKTYAVKPARTYVTVRGKAMRAKFKIPVPRVLEIAGQKAIKVGNGRVRHKTMKGDADVPVYMLTWEQTYTVDEPVEVPDILSTIKDTGAVALYC